MMQIQEVVKRLSRGGEWDVVNIQLISERWRRPTPSVSRHVDVKALCLDQKLCQGFVLIQIENARERCGDALGMPTR